MDINHVEQAIIKSYRGLRTRIGIISFAFPVLLIIVGRLVWGIEVQPTLSNYYFAQDLVRLDHYPVRLWFCGILFVVGFFLFRYRGFSPNEDRWLSVAGVFALGVAIFPMSIDGKNEYDFALSWISLPFISQLSLHGICAVLAFTFIAVVIVWYADSTLSELKNSNPSAYIWYKRVYRGIAVFMIVSIGISIVLKYLFDNWGITNVWEQYAILIAETAGIWSFAAYWFVKNSELSLVADEVKKARGRVTPQWSKPDIVDML